MTLDLAKYWEKFDMFSTLPETYNHEYFHSLSSEKQKEIDVVDPNDKEKANQLRAMHVECIRNFDGALFYVFEAFYDCKKMAPRAGAEEIASLIGNRFNLLLKNGPVEVVRRHFVTRDLSMVTDLETYKPSSHLVYYTICNVNVFSDCCASLIWEKNFIHQNLMHAGNQTLNQVFFCQNTDKKEKHLHSVLLLVLLNGVQLLQDGKIGYNSHCKPAVLTRLDKQSKFRLQQVKKILNFLEKINKKKFCRRFRQFRR